MKTTIQKKAFYLIMVSALLVTKSVIKNIKCLYDSATDSTSHHFSMR